jgi:hypothetical protein
LKAWEFLLQVLAEGLHHRYGSVMIDVIGRSNAAVDCESQVHGAIRAVERLAESGGEVDDQSEDDEDEADVRDRLSHGNDEGRKIDQRCTEESVK